VQKDMNMGSTTFSGPVTSLNGFIGTVTGNITGDITGNVTGDLTGRVFGTVGTRSGAGAVPLTAATVQVTTTGSAAALTLANGTVGQILTIVMTTDGGGDATLTPTTKTGFSTITFDAVGNSVTLQYFTTLGWMILANNGATVA
jgi:hypothetical protein